MSRPRPCRRTGCKGVVLPGQCCPVCGTPQKRPGREWTLPQNRPHWTLRVNRMHWTLPESRLHWTLEGRTRG